ncbi:hypothetical protein VF14_14830 [Nostoc linckia z18]|jgi:hypothetical protein|uniref:Uncharacterized protein n=2 Tax=Nostoc linckia TaxID=92942 RepID=A0A9Q5ZAK9_NOSLI|nr:hypothetical protein [Nostoc linckia]PHK39812.1 hypothetical protein VF12_12785 [Nostoc linckia z15]PHK46572.1 hypothetical protein VF13_10255 [Nostoc linckia z16]PHJ60442.1 hypothetical protein VF02_22315 [Nostoc linckia z1]PHJ63987.1 hypothetical protein VF05_23285 [Nostoc linckia z3]PHJ76388.1 hypothetical protein VF03_07850 [Nostoc linckia z2]
MATLNLNVEQVITLVKQLAIPEQRMILQAIKAEQDSWWQNRLDYGELQIRSLSTTRGLNWDIMTEQEREEFIDNILYE